MAIRSTKLMLGLSYALLCISPAGAARVINERFPADTVTSGPAVIIMTPQAADSSTSPTQIPEALPMYGDDQTSASVLTMTSSPAADSAGLTAPGDAEASIRQSLAGKRITLSLDSANILEVIKLLSQSARMNIIAGPDVEGIVSVNLFDVPLGDALDSILGIGGYSYYLKGNVIYIASEKRKRDLPLAAHDLLIQSYTINHADAKTVQEAVTAFLSPSGRAVLTTAKQLLVQDAPDYLRAIDQVVHHLDEPPRQVLISAKIFSVKIDDDLTLGVGFNRSQSQDLNDGQIITQGFAQNPLNLSAGATGLFAGKAIRNLNFFLETLQARGNLEVLAAPQLLVLDGQRADIQVGDRLGFHVVTLTDTARVESVEFLDVGTILEVTPHVGDDGLIRLDLHPKVSNGQISPDGLPTENTTEASTSMLVNDQETILIGGLIKLQKQTVRSQIPLLGDIPYLGYLFGRTRKTDSKQELVILINTEIVAPTATPAMQKQIDVVDSRRPFLEKDQSLAEWPENYKTKMKR